MEDNGIRMMAIVFGGMVKMMIGCLVLPLAKEVQVDLLICIMMEDVFQKYLIKIGKYFVFQKILGFLQETMSKSDVAINQKVNINFYSTKCKLFLRIPTWLSFPPKQYAVMSYHLLSQIAVTPYKYTTMVLWNTLIPQSMAIMSDKRT